MKETATHIYFWGGIYSQWAKTSFQIQGKKFSTAEQFMMYSKARLFNDLEVAEAILKTDNPKVQKSLGRKVENFDDKIWNDHKFEIVVRGNFYKFSQNEGLKKQLLSTDNKILVEGSPYDKIWGVGLKYDDPKILNEANWQGENLLGQALMKVREIIKASDAKDKFYLEYGEGWEL